MTALMRQNLAKLYADFRTAHAGLLIQRGLREWDDNSEKPIKKELIDERISLVRANELYLLAFHRWLNLTYQNDNFANLSAKINGRLYTGLALGQTLETGAMTHHTYGMPMIAGSSIKGAVRHYTEQLFAERDENNNIRYRDKQIIIQDDKKYVLDILFGKDDSSNAGYLVWHDAWWIAPVTSDMKLSQGENARPFASEIVTVHHQKYYQGDMKEALDIESPIPNQQIAIQGEFYFSIEGEEQWAEFAKLLLTRMLQEQGVGAKGSNGYGYFEESSRLINPYLEVIEERKNAQQAQEQAQALEKEMADLNENQALIYEFKSKLQALDEKTWKSNPNNPPKIEIGGEQYWFAELFAKTNDWNDDDQKYALTELFAVYQKSLSKKMQDKVKEMKKKFKL